MTREQFEAKWGRMTRIYFAEHDPESHPVMAKCDYGESVVAELGSTDLNAISALDAKLESLKAAEGSPPKPKEESPDE